MGAYLRPHVSRRLITTIIRQRKKDIGEIEKCSQKNVRIMYNSSCVCIYVCVFVKNIFAYYCMWSYK